MPADQLLLLVAGASLVGLVLSFALGARESSARLYVVVGVVLGVVAIHTIAVWARYRQPGSPIEALAGNWSSLGLWLLAAALTVPVIARSRATTPVKLVAWVSAVACTFSLGMLATLWVACAHADCF
jgi:hypothetical protein